MIIERWAQWKKCRTKAIYSLIVTNRKPETINNYKSMKLKLDHQYKWLIPVVLAFTISACGNAREDEASPERIMEEISAYRSQINDLTVKVNRLERQLAEMGAGDLVRNRVAVTATELDHERFENFFKVSGSVEAVNKAMISPETSGHLQQIYVYKGEAVKKGQVVARLSTHVIESNIAEVKTSLELAETVYERQKRLWSQEIGSEIQYLEAKNNVNTLQSRLKTLESQMDMAVMRSPINGYVDETFVKEGELVMPGTPVMEIINLDQLYINSDVSEAYLPYLHAGEEVLLRFPAWPEILMEVPVHRIGHVINPENRTFRMQLRIQNKDNKYKPNMMANLSIRSFTVEDAIVVPTMLIGFDTQGHYVFTAAERNGVLVSEKTYIERGPDAEGKTLVKSGLSKGDMLITRGHTRISDGDFIRLSSN